MADFALYEEQFSGEHDFPAFAGAPRFVVIASTRRSGSHMLGHALHQTGAFGFPLEYLNPRNVREWERRLRVVGVRSVLDALIAKRTSPNGVFGIKLHYDHVENLGGPAALKQLFPDAVYIFLRRRNVVAQAVSYAKASQTGVWIDAQEALAADSYDFRSIDQRLRRILRETAAWEYWLNAGGADTLELTFEDVVGNLKGAIESIAVKLKISPDGITIPESPPTKPLSTATNDAWISRFRSEYAGEGLFDPTSTARRLARQVGRMIRRRR